LGSTVEKAEEKEVEARNFYGRKIRMYVIGVTAVKFGTFLDRKNLTAVKFGREERCDPGYIPSWEHPLLANCI
jgi:hypothetical protein